MSSSHNKIGFLGAGKMATALAKGMIKAGLASGDQIIASDPVEAVRNGFAQTIKGKATALNLDVIGAAEVILLAVKPEHVSEVLAEIRPNLSPKHLLISIAAGIPLARLEGALNPGARVVRVMPNTPALVGSSATAFAPGAAATKEDSELVFRLFGAIGIVFQLKESLLDAVTGLSGSGPAYVFLVIEALSDGGVAAGLPREMATKLAAQTVLGSGRMALETGIHPGVLKDMVTSPGGTTIEGIHELEIRGVRAAFMNAVRAAAEKSKRLGGK